MHPLVHMKGIGMRFGAATVLENVDLTLRAGEVHILAGENGAGKSTLIKILSGVYGDYAGTVDAPAASIAVIYQELSLVPSMTVRDNLFLGRFRTHRGFIDDAAQQSEAVRLLEPFGLANIAGALVEDLPAGVRQIVEIARALGRDASVIVMDEPTSALSATDAERLFEIVVHLKERGCAILYVTHRMEEVERLADRITVLRDGRVAGTSLASELPIAKMIEWMVGREVSQQFPVRVRTPGTERLRIESPSLFVRAGEILGIAGLQGSGASEVLTWIFDGTMRRILLDGRPAEIRGPRDAIAKGIALLTADRKTDGLVMPLTLCANMTLASLERLSPWGWRNLEGERSEANRLFKSLKVRAASMDMEAGELSGGNQQKVALAKWLMTEPRLLLLNDPTRGIDIGAKQEIYHLMNDWTARGMAILLVSSDLPELIALSDRVAVMHRGKLTATYECGEVTAERVIAAAMGGLAA